MKILRPLALATGGALAVAAPAAAHVTLDPREAPADSFVRFAIRVPNESPDAATIKLTVRLPLGLTSVAFQPKPGWTRRVVTQKLAKPIQVFGETVTERVATVTWSGGSIGPGEFDEFGVSAHVPNTPGRELRFPAVQTYAGGEVARWIGGSGADEPAPSLVLMDAAGGDAQSSTQTASASATDETGDEDDRAGPALVVGIAGLAVALIALGVALFRGRSAVR